MSARLAGLLLLGWAVAAPAQQPPLRTTQGISEPIYSESVIEQIRVETPYGVMYGEVKRPVVPEGVKVPVILTITPYNILASPTNQTGSIADDSVAAYFVPRGYARASFDLLGTRESSGCYDNGGLGEVVTDSMVVDYLGELPWSNGKVGMIGGSYDGTTQLSAAIAQPRHLAALIPQVAVDRWYDYAYGAGVRYFLNSEHPTDEGIDTPAGYDFGFAFIPPLDVTGTQYIDAMRTRINLCERLDHMQHGYALNPVYDDFWKERDYRAMAHLITVPTMMEGGWLDNNVKHWDSTRFYAALPEDLPKRLIMGQWNHAASQYDDAQDIRHAWFDYWLLGLDTGVMDLPAIDSQANDGIRRQGDVWPPPGTRTVTFTLDGSAQPALALRNTNAAIFTDNPALTEEQMFSQLGCLNACLMFSSEPLEAPLRISGDPQLHLKGSINAAGTHYTPVLYDEAPDGAREIITRGFLNLRNRNGLEVSEPVVAGETWTATVDLWDVDWVIPAGHRLGITLSSSNAIWALPDLTMAKTTLDLAGASLDVPLSEGAESLLPPEPPATGKNAVLPSRFGGALGFGALLVLGVSGVLRRRYLPASAR